jgi:hypothetical protein
MNVVTVKLEIEIEGPVLTAGLATPAYGIDSGFLRDPDGGWILPGTLVKGLVSHTLQLMSEKSPSLLPSSKRIDWLGRNTGDARDPDRKDANGNEDADKSLRPQRGIVRFGDLRLQKETVARLTRIAVDDDTGSVKRGMLQILETPLGFGEKGTFAGTLTVAKNKEEAEQVAVWVKRALDLWPAIGSAKSAGFGRIVEVHCTVSANAASSPSAAAMAPRGDHVLYTLKFSELLLVASQSISGNLFKSSDDIPGGVVKGALARVIESAGRMPELGQALDRMIIRHAKPTLAVGEKRPPVRPKAIPLSLFSVETFENNDFQLSELLDASNEKQDPEEYAEYGLIAFQPDWKHDTMSVARREFKHTAEFRRDVRTRTAIDDKKGTSQTSQLFSRIALDPAGHIWVGWIARGKANKAAFADILKIMQQGLPGIGKTGVTAEVALFDAKPEQATLLDGAKPDRWRWRIVIETDALLHGPDTVFEHGDMQPEQRLGAQYRAYFAAAVNHRLGAETVRPDALELRFFARQRWAGGYQALRFPAKAKGSYYPHLVTEAGSVFVLDAPEVATPAIETFIERGLPLPEGVPPAEMEYQRSPFVPQNGYGEVSIGDYFVWKKNA